MHNITQPEKYLNEPRGEHLSISQEQLIRDERRFRALIENNLDGIALLGEDATVLYASPSTPRTLGYSARDFVGRNAFEFMHPDDVTPARALFEKLLTHPGMMAAGEFRYRHRNGSWRRLDSLARNLLAEPSVQAIVTNYRDVTDRWEAEELLKASLREKEVLLKEVHHRVKNNLQVISSLLQLRAGAVNDPHAVAILRESQICIRSMALIHEKLYLSDRLARIDFAEYLRSLVTALFRSYQADPDLIHFRLHADKLLLGIDTATSCGLIVTELVSNCLKYAFPPERNGGRGMIEIVLAANDSHTVTLSIRDNGVGLPANISFGRTDSFGLALVRAMAEQLGASVDLIRSEGTEFRLAFGQGMNIGREFGV